jgi:hypothetical protein
MGFIMTREELNKAIEEKNKEIVGKQRELDLFELDNDDYEKSYKECLDDSGTVEVAGISFDPSQILEELDPTAYRCGLNDYVDSKDKEEDPKFKELEKELEELESELVDLESELEEIDNE